MSYTLKDIENYLDSHGEVMLNMDNDEEYELHKFNTEFNHTSVAGDTGYLEVEGMHEGVWQKRRISPDKVQDMYIHYEF